ncbi:hypothetical protein KF728_02295 [Candidatus Obscuribacterales bacterium]|nr:hypothetical protein [Candidatus Obscuribacterales bacterium]
MDQIGRGGWQSKEARLKSADPKMYSKELGYFIVKFDGEHRNGAGGQQLHWFL